MRTLVLALVFAGATVTSEDHYQRALRLIEDAKDIRNPIRLMILEMRTIDELDETVRLAPDHLEARFLLVRHAMTVPLLLGGSSSKARKHAREIARRDPALGHLAHGFIAYRSKDHDDAFRELGEAVRIASSPERKALALRWLGWLSQDTQRYEEAFTSFQTLVEMHYLDGLYEIGRTAVFCRCRAEAGEEALQRYIDSSTVPDGPSKRDAQKMLRELKTQRR